VEFEIQRLSHDSREKLVSFLQRAYPGELRKLNARYLDWYYRQNPNVNELPVWIIRHDKEIIGQPATIPVQIGVGGACIKAIWILEFIVLEQFRGKGLRA
jgi:hypothetical protein